MDSPDLLWTLLSMLTVLLVGVAVGGYSVNYLLHRAMEDIGEDVKDHITKLHEEGYWR